MTEKLLKMMRSGEVFYTITTTAEILIRFYFGVYNPFTGMNCVSNIVSTTLLNSIMLFSIRARKMHCWHLQANKQDVHTDTPVTCESPQILQQED